MLQKTFILACLTWSLSLAQSESVSIQLSDWQFSKTELNSPEAAWEQVTVPHCWNATDSQQGGGKEASGHAEPDHVFGYYRGPGSYKTVLPPKWDLAKDSVFIRFDAVSSYAKVYLNGQELGEHLGAFTSFGYDITKLLKTDADNEISVAASNAYRKDILPISGDFPLYGGMYRPVALEIKPKVGISPIADRTSGIRTSQHDVSSDSATLEVFFTVYNSTQTSLKGSFSIQLKDQSGDVVATIDKPCDFSPRGHEIKETLNVKKPTLWQGRENPYLYELSVTVKTDTTRPDSYTTNIGFRDVRFDAQKGLFLNGKHIKPYGVCLHQDWEGIGWALTGENHKKNADIINEIGATMVRFAHYPHAQEAIDFCDKAGIMVWCEIPYVDSIGKPKVEGVEDVTKRQLVEMIRQYANHPSIITWGLSNELFHRPTDDPLPLLRELNELAKKEDTTRPTVIAVNRPGNEDLCTVADLLGLNAYPGWYGGSAEGMKGSISSLHGRYPETPVSISEYGHGGSIKHHDRNITKAPKADGKWHPEEYQARGHEKNWEAIAAQEATWGTFIWNLCDFASVWRDEGDRPGINDKGLVTFDRETKKDAFYFYKANWRSDIPVLHLQEKRATPTRDKEVKIRFYTNLDQYSVTLNGKKVDKINRYSLNAYETNPQPLQPGENTVVITATDAKGDTIKDEVVWVLEEE